RHRAIDPLELMLAAGLDLEPRAEAARGFAGDQEVLVEVARRRLNAGGDVDGVADDRVVEAPRAADRPGHHGPAVDPHPDPELGLAAAVDRVDELAARADGPLGVVRVVLGRAEDRDQAVADELVDVAAVAG